ncbi:MAG TPA: DNA gyrase inhibitor YacG [Gammaproteobacteria bacterium]
MKRKRECPTCGREIGPDEPRTWRPFCSERCRLIDLGDWMAGRHRIPSEEAPPAEDPPAEDPPPSPLKH